MSRKQILKYSGCFAIFAVAVCIQPAIANPTAGHWVFFAAAVVLFTLCFYFGLVLLAKYKSVRR
ncbi:hypothetical protein MB46_19295 (plasmid) [Arthrobacter alpinus]|nr:hypothetical protein MB46_19295 [Arthrobacter alpinus]